jgi:hypothetical protein
MVYDEEAGRNVVSEAPAYQVKGLDEFIKSLPTGQINHENDNTKQYIFENDTVRDDCQDNITQGALVFSINTFSINTFNYKKLSLQGTYDDFYELNSHTGKTYMLSYNENKLSGFCGWVNRLTT